MPVRWENVAGGFIVYNDIAGHEWTTEFSFGTGEHGYLPVCFHKPPSKVDVVGDPRTRMWIPTDTTRYES